MKTSTLVAKVPWLLERVPANTRLGQNLAELDHRTRNGAAALCCWDAWREPSKRIELRHLRTRNAIFQGGLLSPATVHSVALFAERPTSSGLITRLDARLAGGTIASYFRDRQARLAEMRRRLFREDPNDPPDEILFD